MINLTKLRLANGASQGDRLAFKVIALKLEMASLWRERGDNLQTFLEQTQG
jgi:hypothetical protein